MPARRTSWILATAGDGSEDEKAARLAGDGLDWAEEPADLNDAALAEWRRLGGVFEDNPTRFREGDRHAVIAYCRCSARLAWLEKALDRTGPLVKGRGKGDEDRWVKNPLFSTWNQTQAALRMWARELGLTPDSRHRVGHDDKGNKINDDEGNPFA